MKTLVYNGPHNISIKDQEIKNENDVLVKVSYTGICGSDIGILTGKHPRAEAPLILGHEFSGEVVEIKNNVQNVSVGDKVVVYPLLNCGKCLACRTGNEHVCNTLKLIGIDKDGGMAEYASVPSEMIYKIPNTLDYDVAALIEPIAVVIHGVRESNLKFDDTVLVTGAGPIGLLMGLVLKDAGVTNLYFSEIDKFRLEMSEKFGFKIIDPSKSNLISFINDRTDDEGVDILFEASGAPNVLKNITDLVRVKGQIEILSVFKEASPVNLRDINFKELNIIGSRVYTRQDYEKAIQFAEQNQKLLSKVITHKVPLKNGTDAFELLNDSNINTLKVLINCQEI